MVKLSNLNSKYSTGATALLAVARKIGPADAPDQRATWLIHAVGTISNGWTESSIDAAILGSVRPAPRGPLAEDPQGAYLYAGGLG